MAGPSSRSPSCKGDQALIGTHKGPIGPHRAPGSFLGPGPGTRGRDKRPGTRGQGQGFSNFLRPDQKYKPEFGLKICVGPLTPFFRLPYAACLAICCWPVASVACLYYRVVASVACPSHASSVACPKHLRMVTEESGHHSEEKIPATSPTDGPVGTHQEANRDPPR